MSALNFSISKSTVVRFLYRSAVELCLFTAAELTSKKSTKHANMGEIYSSKCNVNIIFCGTFSLELDVATGFVERHEATFLVEQSLGVEDAAFLDGAFLLPRHPLARLLHGQQFLRCRVHVHGAVVSKDLLVHLVWVGLEKKRHTRLTSFFK